MLGLTFCKGDGLAWAAHLHGHMHAWQRGSGKINSSITLTTTHSSPKLPFGKRYIDDILLFWTGTTDELGLFVEYLNSTTQHLCFAVEQSNEKVKFLDLTIYNPFKPIPVLFNSDEDAVRVDEDAVRIETLVGCTFLMKYREGDSCAPVFL